VVFAENSPRWDGAWIMSIAAGVPLGCRADLVVRPLGDRGQVVVKDPLTGSYFNLGEEEAFLLSRLDGRRTAETICDEFEARFGGPLTEADLDGFLEQARDWGLLQAPEAPVLDPNSRPGAGPGPRTRTPGPPRPRQSLLAWRHSLFDPDRLFNWLEPRIRFFWTRWFLAVSAGCILAAALLAWSERNALARPLTQGWRWELLALGWLTLIGVTTLHEFAHGLTCKHHGGEVHEVGVLLLFLMPGMYCNVSDSWLVTEKWKRIWVTLAGGYFELFLWSLAVFTWRMTIAGSPLNTLTWGVVSVSGVRVFLNFNPLLKLDGYYILSDLLEIPNLRQRSWSAWLGHLRRWLWGGSRPTRQPRGKFLLGFGMVSWCFSLTMVTLMVSGLVRVLVPRGGWIAVGLTLLLGMLILKGILKGFFAGEFRAMIDQRRRRTAGWVLALGGLPVVLALGQIEHQVRGTFKVRPITRVELRAPVAGFLRSVYLDEGDRVSPGMVVARLEVPDLDTNLAQKHAELRQARAEQRKAEIGARPEEVDEKRLRVERARHWCELARFDLRRVRAAYAENLENLHERIVQGRHERSHAAGSQRRTRALFVRGYVSAEEFQLEQLKATTAASRLKQAETEARAREAEGTREAEAELARRENELAEAQTALDLLLAGSRPEDLDAARAHTAQLEEEVSYLEGLKEKLPITSRVPGKITTPRLREKVGQYFQQGDLIGEVQAVATLEAEITLEELSVTHVRPGQTVELKARALPFQTHQGQVDRVAPSAVRLEAEAQSVVIVYCRLSQPAPGLKPEMTGYARISCGRRPIGEILLERLLGFLRTEFWL
jgi:multidrug efflux pump subunit AcrA (membrane-fusion protein)